MNIIGLKGRLHSGKDTAVEFLKDAAGPGCNVDRAGFADKMKRSSLEALGFDTTDWTNDDVLDQANQIKERGSIITVWADDDDVAHTLEISGRLHYQRYGTEAHRNVFWDAFWVDALLPLDPGDLQEAFPDTDLLVVTDCRFPNEAQRVLDLGGQVWQIDAESRLGPLPEGSHISEHPLPTEYVTMTVPNNDSVEQFGVAIKAAYQMAFGGFSC